MTAGQLVEDSRLGKKATSEMAQAGAVEKENASETGPRSNVTFVWIRPEMRSSVYVAIYSGMSCNVSWVS